MTAEIEVKQFVRSPRLKGRGIRENAGDKSAMSYFANASLFTRYGIFEKSPP